MYQFRCIVSLRISHIWVIHCFLNMSFYPRIFPSTRHLNVSVAKIQTITSVASSIKLSPVSDYSYLVSTNVRSTATFVTAETRSLLAETSSHCSCVIVITASTISSAVIGIRLLPLVGCRVASWKLHSLNPSQN